MLPDLSETRSKLAAARGSICRKAATGSGVFMALMKSLPPMKTPKSHLY
jgi:hypothetical protein